MNCLKTSLIDRDGGLIVASEFIKSDLTKEFIAITEKGNLFRFDTDSSIKNLY